MKRMLINATQREELRVALVDGQRLFDLDIETPSREKKKANIYRGRVMRVEPSLEAAFVEYGGGRHGFLPLKEVARSCFKGDPDSDEKVNIKEQLTEGQEIVVQIDKEERGTKGAALTTFISLAGRFLVLMPNNPRAGGVSRRVEGADRDDLRAAMSQLQVPQGMGAIVRTAGVGRSVEELQWDLDNLVQSWSAIQTASETRKAPFLIYEEGNAVVRSLRDYLTADIGEVLIDDSEMFEEALSFVRAVMPQVEPKLKLYSDEVPLFTRYQIESQIESAYTRDVTLPAGGAIVIDPTEALVSIDINSARATKGSDIEQTALNTNMEAAEEIARQLRLRDIGGLIVIDFIDMGPAKNQKLVEEKLRDAVRVDRARVQIGRISRFGLLEMSRQRLRPSLDESAHHVCPRCQGQGNIRSVQSLSLSVLRLVEEEARKERTARIIAQVPVEVGSFLLNEKRSNIREIEGRYRTHVVLVPDPQLETPHYTVRRVRDDETDLPENKGRSFEMRTDRPEAVDPSEVAKTQVSRTEEPAVKRTEPTTPAPITAPKIEPKRSDSQGRGRGRPAPKKPGLFAKIAAFFSGGGDKKGDARGGDDRPDRSRSRRGTRGGRNRRGRGGNAGGDRESQGQGRGRGDRSGSDSNSARGSEGENKGRSRGGRGRGDRNRNDGNRNDGNQANRDQSARDDSRSADTPSQGPQDSQAAQGQNGNAESGAGAGTGRKRSRRGGRRRRRGGAAGDPSEALHDSAVTQAAQTSAGQDQSAGPSATDADPDKTTPISEYLKRPELQQDDAATGAAPRFNEQSAQAASPPPARTEQGEGRQASLLPETRAESPVEDISKTDSAAAPEALPEAAAEPTQDTPVSSTEQSPAETHEQSEPERPSEVETASEAPAQSPAVTPDEAPEEAEPVAEAEAPAEASAETPAEVVVQEAAEADEAEVALATTDVESKAATEPAQAVAEATVQAPVTPSPAAPEDEDRWLRNLQGAASNGDSTKEDKAPSSD
jgi:ribonuclease E